MSTPHPSISPALAAFIQKQPLFFVATAPLQPDGLLNLSPKGLDTFTVIDEKTVAYLDLTGSGVETIAHLRENGRIVLMFCAFEGSPQIVRLHGRGRVVEPSSPEFGALSARFKPHSGARAVICIDVRRVSTSCGHGVPLMDLRGHRPNIPAWCERQGPAGLRDYREKKNSVSIDGLPGLDR